jgi:hypothetical protein
MTAPNTGVATMMTIRVISTDVTVIKKARMFCGSDESSTSTS